MGWGEDETTLQEIARSNILSEDRAAYNWRKRHESYRGLREDVMRCDFMQHAHPTLAPCRPSPSPETIPEHQFRVGVSGAADIACSFVLHQRFPKQPPLPHEVGSAHMWPRRFLKQQNVMEWRNYMNTTAANNRMLDQWRTTNGVEFNNRGYGVHYQTPPGKTIRQVSPDQERQVSKLQKRCYANVPVPVRTHKNMMRKITLKQACAPATL